MSCVSLKFRGLFQCSQHWFALAGYCAALLFSGCGKTANSSAQRGENTAEDNGSGEPQNFQVDGFVASGESQIVSGINLVATGLVGYLYIPVVDQSGVMKLLKLSGTVTVSSAERGAYKVSFKSDKTTGSDRDTTTGLRNVHALVSGGLSVLEVLSAGDTKTSLVAAQKLYAIVNVLTGGKVSGVLSTANATVASTVMQLYAAGTPAIAAVTAQKVLASPGSSAIAAEAKKVASKNPTLSKILTYADTLARAIAVPVTSSVVSFVTSTAVLTAEVIQSNAQSLEATVGAAAEAAIATASACLTGCVGAPTESTTATPTPTTSPSGKYYVFVSSQSYSGALGGLPGADTKCNDLAQAESTLSQYKGMGQWKAILSDSNTSTRDRISIASGKVVYNIQDGQDIRIAENHGDLFDGGIVSAIEFDNEGNSAGGLSAWTGSNSLGAKSGGNCSNWTSEGDDQVGHQGYTSSSDSSWLAGQDDGCSGMLMPRLYCISNQ